MSERVEMRYTRLPNMDAIHELVDALFEAKCDFELRPNANGMYGSVWYPARALKTREIVERIEAKYRKSP